MGSDPQTALNHLRLLRIRKNKVDEVLAYLATPAASGFVLNRSRAATRKNIAHPRGDLWFPRCWLVVPLMTQD